MLHDTPNIGSKKFFDAATKIIKVSRIKLRRLFLLIIEKW